MQEGKKAERQEKTRTDSTLTAASVHATTNEFLLNITLVHKVDAMQQKMPSDGPKCSPCGEQLQDM